MLRTGSPWHDVQDQCGPYTTVYNRFYSWAKQGIRLRMSEALAERSLQFVQLTDSSTVRAQKKVARITPFAVLVAD